MEKVLRDRKAILLFILPGLILYTAFVTFPVLWSVYYSFYEGMPGFANWTFKGLGNYVKLFSDKNFTNAFSVNLRYMAIVMVGQVCIGLMLSLRFKFWVKRAASLVRTIVFFPVVLPVVAVAQLFSKIYEIQPHYGLLNSLLAGIGLEGLVQPWLGQASTVLGALCGMDIWTALGFYAIILYGALLDIPEDIIEAARIDGCHSFQLFSRILLPQLQPMLVTCFIFSFTGTIKMFESSLALTQGGPGGAARSLSMYMYDTAFTYQKTGYASTVALIILLLCLVCSAIIRRFYRKDL